MANQAPNSPLEGIAIPIPTVDREAVIGDLVTPGMGFFAHVDEEQETTRSTRAGFPLEGVICCDESVLPRRDDEVARGVLAERRFGHAVFHSVGNAVRLRVLVAAVVHAEA